MTIVKREIVAADVVDAINKYASMYETVEGRRVIGDRLSNLSSILRGNGWRNVPRFNQSDVRQLGLEIVFAQYVNGRPTGKFVPVVVVRDVPELPTSPAPHGL